MEGQTNVRVRLWPGRTIEDCYALAHRYGRVRNIRLMHDNCAFIDFELHSAAKACEMDPRATSTWAENPRFERTDEIPREENFSSQASHTPPAPSTGPSRGANFATPFVLRTLTAPSRPPLLIRRLENRYRGRSPPPTDRFRRRSPSPSRFNHSRDRSRSPVPHTSRIRSRSPRPGSRFLPARGRSPLPSPPPLGRSLQPSSNLESLPRDTENPTTVTPPGRNHNPTVLSRRPSPPPPPAAHALPPLDRHQHEINQLDLRVESLVAEINKYKLALKRMEAANKSLEEKIREQAAQLKHEQEGKAKFDNDKTELAAELEKLRGEIKASRRDKGRQAVELTVVRAENIRLMKEIETQAAELKAENDKLTKEISGLKDAAAARDEPNIKKKKVGRYILGVIL